MYHTNFNDKIVCNIFFARTSSCCKMWRDEKEQWTFTLGKWILHDDVYQTKLVGLHLPFETKSGMVTHSITLENFVIQMHLFCPPRQIWMAIHLQLFVTPVFQFVQRSPFKHLGMETPLVGVAGDALHLHMSHFPTACGQVASLLCSGILGLLRAYFGLQTYFRKNPLHFLNERTHFNISIFILGDASLHPIAPKNIKSTVFFGIHYND